MSRIDQRKSSVAAAGLLLLVVMAAAGTASAAATKVFRQTTAKDFEEGEATGSMILPTGEVVAGMKTSHVPIDSAFVWCAVPSRDGQVAYFGTGDQGKIYAVETKAPHGGDERPARKVADLDAAWVTALAVRNDGTLLAGTTPGGRIYTVDPKSGAAHEWATLSADHVWSLVYDAHTGDDLRRHRIARARCSPSTTRGTRASCGTRATSTSCRWRRSRRARTRCWPARRRRRSSTASASTGTPRRCRTSKPRRCERSRRRVTRSTSRSTTSRRAPRRRCPARSPPRGPASRKASTGAPSSAGSLPRPGQRKAKAGLYRLERDGRIEQIFSLGDGYLTAVLPDAEGTPAPSLARPSAKGGVFVATGTQGKVYRVYKDRTAALALDLPERQVLALVRAGTSFLAGTGDVGGVYRAQPSAGEEASYLSKVLDGEFPARWGMLRWHGTSNLTVETRSGNTAKPDASWNGWREARSAAAGRRRVGGPHRERGRALFAVPRRARRRGRAPARRQPLLRSAEPARARHRADAGRPDQLVVVVIWQRRRHRRARALRRC